jgi:aspartyl-tRNA(Asn)/glutamyl-tRNA(Gln) amidotransferase subunit B
MGAEVHVQVINSDCTTKAFSAALATTEQLPPNTNLDYLDYGLPGALPVFNIAVARAAVRAATALECTIHPTSYFDRKNYGYVDMSSGYQITQFYHPIATGGHVPLVSETDGVLGKIALNRIHIEQDAGKTIHDTPHGHSAVDFNRAGIGLLEIVTEPCFTSIDQIPIFVKTLQSILKTINVSNCSMEHGEMRVDLSVSIRPVDCKTLGTRVEIKNVNSIKDMREAAEYEFQRQAALLEAGGVVLQETRLFDAGTKTTKLMRSKEDAADYLYIPDGNLPALRTKDIETQSIPVLPHQHCQALVDHYKLRWSHAYQITHKQGFHDFFSIVSSNLTITQVQLAANILVGELSGLLTAADRAIESFNPTWLHEIVTLLDTGTISGKTSKYILEKAFKTDSSPRRIVTEEGLGQVSDVSQIKAAIQTVCNTYPEDVQRYKNGETKLFGFFVGACTKQLPNANITTLRQELQHELEKD